MEGEPAGEFYCVPESGVRARCGAIVPKTTVQRCVRSLSGQPSEQGAGAPFLKPPLKKRRLLSGQVKGSLIGERLRGTGQARMPVRSAGPDDAWVVRRLFRAAALQESGEMGVVPTLVPLVQK